MSLASLKTRIRNIEQPAWRYNGFLIQPNFGADPDKYMDHIVHWVGSDDVPQRYGCYALWRITHQQQRIEQLEDIVLRLIKEVEKIKVQQTPIVAVPV
jgi:hypothetical protein